MGGLLILNHQNYVFNVELQAASICWHGRGVKDCCVDRGLKKGWTKRPPRINATRDY